MDNGVIKIIIFFIIGFVVVKSCNNASQSRQPMQSQKVRTETWQKSPVDELIKAGSNEQNFSIILLDMDVENPNASNAMYKHQYRLIVERPDTVVARETEWYPVSAAFFQKNINNMGMEIASKKDGVLTKQASPAGYNNYIGNPQYGQWRERNGSSFWEFYGRYAFMSSMFNLMTYPARRSYWNDYRSNYYGTGRGYYGPSGRNMYGTNSYTSSASGQKSTWGQKPSNFKSRVRSSVSRSGSTASSRRYSSSSSYGRTSRSSSRSYGGTSYRSRSGGYGK